MIIRFFYTTTFILILSFTIISCDDMKDFKERSEVDSTIQDSSILVVLNEGLFNFNNSTITTIDFIHRKINSDFFQTANNRGLGDTGNDLLLYDNKLWAVICVSSSIEVIDPHTGISLKRIPIKDEKGNDRQARFICAGNDKLYVCCFDNTVLEIDPEKYSITHTFKAGRNPDGICYADEKIYISNSGGLDAPDYDHTISVFEAGSLTEIKKIDIGMNPFTIQADSEGDIYVVVRGTAGSSASKLKRISNLKTDSTFSEIPVSNFIIAKDTLYYYYYNYTKGTHTVGLFDCKTEKSITDNLLSGNFSIQIPYGISRNPHNGNIYISDAVNYTVFGTINCFDKNGKFLYKIEKVGLNPGKMVVL